VSSIIIIFIHSCYTMKCAIILYNSSPFPLCSIRRSYGRGTGQSSYRYGSRLRYVSLNAQYEFPSASSQSNDALSSSTGRQGQSFVSAKRRKEFPRIQLFVWWLLFWKLDHTTFWKSWAGQCGMKKSFATARTGWLPRSLIANHSHPDSAPTNWISHALEAGLEFCLCRAMAPRRLRHCKLRYENSVSVHFSVIGARLKRPLTYENITTVATYILNNDNRCNTV